MSTKEPDEELMTHVATYWQVHMCREIDRTLEFVDNCMRDIANAPPATTLTGLYHRADAVWVEMTERMTKDTPRSPLEQAIISVLRDAYTLCKPPADAGEGS